MAAVLSLWLASSLPASLDAQGRPTLGLALGGGSARGIAHVGVLRWLEEHRVPVDLIAGTSMGGLVGGAYAAGMSATELTHLLDASDWDEVFGATAYRYKNIRRKQDARDYPSRLTFRIRRGFSLPVALNNGAEVDLFLARIAAIYGELPSFDSLPTPFRCVAMDLQSGKAVVLDSGSLSRAMRATMSLPAMFPPVDIDSRLLVDGGPMNNVPADVARQMGASVVVAIVVGADADTTNVDASLFSVVGAVTDALMRANTKRGIAAADLVIRPDTRKYSQFDFDRSRELIAAGYAAAEAARDRLLPFAVDDDTWRAYAAKRAAKRRAWPRIESIRVVGMTPHDAREARRLLRRQVGRTPNIREIEAAMRQLGGRDRYQSVSWDLEPRDNAADLVVRAANAVVQPILMATVNAENRTGNDYSFQLAGRALAFDVPFPGDELRIDAALGSNPSAGAELLHHLIGLQAMKIFTAVTAVWSSHQYDVIHGDNILAQYTERITNGQLDLGLERRNFELRGGFRAGRISGDVDVGNPGLPSFSGTTSEIRMRAIFDTQNSPTIPTDGIRIFATGRHVLTYPDPVPVLGDRNNEGLTQAEMAASNFWSWAERRNRIFVAGFGGSSFGGRPLITDQFNLGMPLRLDAFAVGERRGDAYAVLSTGYLRQATRVSNVLGGSICLGAWIETGSAWNAGSDPVVVGQAAVGAIVETLVGPVVARFSAGGGGRRFAFGIGRLF